MEVVSVRGMDELIEINDSEALSKVVIGSQGKYQTKSAPQDYMPAINKLITKTDSDWKEDGHYTSSFNKKMKALRAQTWMNIAKDPNQQDAEKAPIRENHMARLRKNFSPDAAREFIENLDVEDMPDYYKDEKLIADMKVSFKDNPPKNADEMVKFLSDFKSRGNKEFVLRNNMSLKNTTKNIDTLSATLGSVSSVPDTASDKGAAISQLISDSANPGGEIVASIMKSVDGSGSSLEAQFSALDSTNPADDQKIKDLHKAIAVKIEKSKAQFEAQKIKQEAYANVNSIKI
jgi:hypothetical protein